jgi:phosphoglycolate phosphatase
MSDRRRVGAVLFDLDGTLLDTAPDLGAALNQLRLERNLEPLPYLTMRTRVSHGASDLVRLGFPDSSSAMHAELVARFLVLYQNRLAHATRPFDEVLALLDALEDGGIRWGIVTNKPARFTDPLLLALELGARAQVVVSGDTLPERKPSPVPLLYAAERMNVPAAHCMYVGDALRDMQAARAAGMLAIGARFGYIDPAELPHEWPVDGWIESPIGLLEWVERHA